MNKHHLIQDTDKSLGSVIMTEEKLENKTEIKIELNQFSKLIELAEKLLAENIQITKMLAENEARKSDLLQSFEQLFSESRQTKRLLEQEQDQSIELTEKIAELLAERIQINEKLIQGQADNEKLVNKVNKFKKGLEYFDLDQEQESDSEPPDPLPNVELEPEPDPEQELDPQHDLESEPLADDGFESTPDPDLDSKPQLEADLEPDSASISETSRSRVVSQREKLSPRSERITDNFINKLFGKKANSREYRRKTKYHLAVWKLAFTMIVNSLLYLFITGAFAIMLLLFAQNILAESNVMGISALRVASASMEPEIPINSLILVRQDNPNNLEVGQIATYLRGDGLLITHRIFYIEQDNNGNKTGFILKGDANIAQSEEIVPSENIIGRVVFASHIIGQLLMFFEARFMLIIAITIFLLVVLYLIKRKKNRVIKNNK